MRRGTSNVLSVRLPTVLIRVAVTRNLAQRFGGCALFAIFFYGTGRHITEGRQLRAKAIDFDRRAMLIGNSDVSWICTGTRT
jgi:hypothetical protein